MTETLVAVCASLFVGRRSWSPASMRGARVWHAAVADSLHGAALLEDLRRRGGARTARECSERDWLRQAIDPAVLDANVAAYAAHRHEVTVPAPRRPSRRRSLSKWALGMSLHAEGAA